MKGLLLLLATLGAGCADVAEPPFTFRVIEHDGQVLTTVLEAAFANYATARRHEPFQLELSEAGATAVLAFEIGMCAALPCTGPLALEELHVSLTPDVFRSEHVIAYRSVGLDGLYEFQGIDGSGFGDCR